MKNNETGSFMPKNENGVWVYSQLLKKPFETLDELKQAEEEYNRVHALELKKAEARKNKAKEVEDAFKALEETKIKAASMVSEATNKAINTRNEFVKEFGPYHATVTRVVNIGNLFDELEKTINSGIFGTWNNF